MHHEQTIYKGDNGILIDIEKDTVENNDFRRVLYTPTKSQLYGKNLCP